MSPSKEPPTILLLPGAFTTPACYDHLAPHFQNAGYPVSRATLLSTNPPDDPSLCTAEREGQHLLNTYLLPLIEADKDVLVFAHSFGATSCSGGKSGLSKKARKATGKQGGVIGLIYIATCFPHSGVSQLELLGGIWPPFCKTHHPSPGLLVFDPVIETLYHDITNPALQKHLGEGHLPQALACFETPVKEPLWSDPDLEGRRVYLLTKGDRVFPPGAQRGLVEGSGVGWEVREVEGGHCCFVGVEGAEGVAAVVLGVVGRWM